MKMVWVEHPNVPDSLHMVEMERFEGTMGMNGWLMADPPEVAPVAEREPRPDPNEVRRLELAESMKAAANQPVSVSTRHDEMRASVAAAVVAADPHETRRKEMVANRVIPTPDEPSPPKKRPAKKSVARKKAVARKTTK